MFLHKAWWYINDTLQKPDVLEPPFRLPHDPHKLKHHHISFVFFSFLHVHKLFLLMNILVC